MNSTQQRLAKIFNEWAKRYAENPSEFSEILDAEGKPFPDYGEHCAFYFQNLSNEIDKQTVVEPAIYEPPAGIYKPSPTETTVAP